MPALPPARRSASGPRGERAKRPLCENFGKPSRRRFAARTAEDRSTVGRAWMDAPGPAFRLVRQTLDEALRDDATVTNTTTAFNRIWRNAVCNLSNKNRRQKCVSAMWNPTRIGLLQIHCIA